MTLAEVIDTLQTWIRNADDEYDREEMGRVAGLKEALHEIKKIEPCEDAISRRAVIDMTGLSEWFDSSDSYNEFVIALSELPPVTPQPKAGHWIRWYEQKETDWYVENIPHCKCSECGKEYDPHSSQFIKYCNECGAKMVEPQESESNK